MNRVLLKRPELSVGKRSDGFKILSGQDLGLYLDPLVVHRIGSAFGIESGFCVFYKRHVLDWENFPVKKKKKGLYLNAYSTTVDPKAASAKS